MQRSLLLVCLAAPLAILLAGCGDKGDDAKGGAGSGESRGGRGGPGGPGAGQADAAVPVEVTIVRRLDISSFIETNGTLEAEQEVDLIARTSGPVVELLAEEAQPVRKGQRLARLDQDQVRANLAVSQVELQEAELTFERVTSLHERDLVSREDFEASKARLDAAKARHQSNQIQLDYTDIRAPFDGLVVERYVKLAENVGVNAPLFRISDFDPLLVRIQVPERELGQLHPGQSAYLTVESFPNERFQASVLRLSPVVDAATGTIRVTLEIEGQDRLRPGMFASVYLRTATHPQALVIPKGSLALESIGDTVYVAVDGDGTGAATTAARREVKLGFKEGDRVEILEGISEGDRVVSVGQDGLADGTPIQVLRAHDLDGKVVADRVAADGADPAAAGEGQPQGDRPAGGWGGRDGGGRPGGGRDGGGPGRGFDISKMTPEQIEGVKARMRERGMTDAQIDERLKRMRERASEGQ